MHLTRYALIGIWNTAFGLSALTFLSLVFAEVNSLLILGFSYAVSTLQSHFSQRRFVWGSNAKYLPELAKFSSFYFLQFLLNAFLLILITIIFDIPRELIQLWIIGTLTLVFFFVNKNGVFNAKRKQIQ
jgi:putative flippase GtrA